MQTGKSLGPDGFPKDFFRAYANSLLPFFHKMLAQTQDSGTLSLSMREAIIGVLLKTGKELELCSSYRPILLLNVDIKILAKAKFLLL